MIVTIAEVEVEVKGVTAIEDLEVMIGDPGMFLLAWLCHCIYAKEFAKYIPTMLMKANGSPPPPA